MTDLDTLKQEAAERSLQLIEPGMILGLGSGSTAYYMLKGLGERLADGRLHQISGVPTSEHTAALARQFGIPLTTLDQNPTLDLGLDGADEVDPHLNLIKGLGGALLREKIVASAAKRFVVFVDDRKCVQQLGERAPVPVEVITFGLAPIRLSLTALGCDPVLRRNADGSPLVTDEGNIILDCHFPPIADPPALAAALKAIPGVVEHGMFLGMAERVFIAGNGSVQEITRS